LVLQAGAPLDSAFDARSLCHDIVVPFEQNALEPDAKLCERCHELASM